MSYLFELAAELGDKPAGVAGIATAFDGATWILSDGTTIECQFKPSPSNPWTGPDGNLWCRLTPNGVGMTGGVRSVTSDEMLVEVAMQMYGVLRGCSGFRFALVGWEVAESVEVSELLNSKPPGAEFPAGLVVSLDLWTQMGCPAAFVPFGDHTVWKPLEDCDYRALVKLFRE